MAGATDRYGQRIEEIAGTVASTIASTVDSFVTKFIGDPDVEAAAFVLFDVTQPLTIVDVALHLQKLSGWKVSHELLPSTAEGPMVAFKVTRDVQLASKKIVPSEALVLGPLDGFPATRKAPITAIEIFVGTPPEIDPKSQKPTERANLAHVTMTGMPPSVFKGQWDMSVKHRLIELGNIDDPRAKAKVAFVVRPAIVQSLGYTQ